MGKNYKGGKKHKKYKRTINEPRNLILADKTQQYFRITKMLGDGRCLGDCSDGRIDVLCIIRGNMRKKVWINKDDIVLGSYRDFSSKPVADIIYKYSQEEVINLKKTGVIFNVENIKKEDYNLNNEIGFTFEDL